MAKLEFPPLFSAGLHAMTVSEMRTMLVDKFRGSVRRKAIMDGLEKVIKILIEEHIQAQIWIDGSFVTKKIDPFDSDILVLVNGDFYEKATPRQKSVIGWINADLSADYLCHSFVHFIHQVGHPEFADSEQHRAYWLRQFGFSRKNEPKGIVMINIP